MTSFADSEKRLNAALERIARALDGGPAQTGADGGDAALAAENAALSGRLAEAEAALADARATIATLEAARAEEAAALDDIMTELEAMIAAAPPPAGDDVADAPYAEDVTPAPGDVLPFDKQEG